MAGPGIFLMDSTIKLPLFRFRVFPCLHRMLEAKWTFLGFAHYLRWRLCALLQTTLQHSRKQECPITFHLIIHIQIAMHCIIAVHQKWVSIKNLFLLTSHWGGRGVVKVRARRYLTKDQDVRESLLFTPPSWCTMLKHPVQSLVFPYLTYTFIHPLIYGNFK